MAETHDNLQPEWMTTPELSAWLRIPTSSIYDWRRRGDGPPAYRIGRHLRWHRDDVMHWLEERRAA